MSESEAPPYTYDLIADTTRPMIHPRMPTKQYLAGAASGFYRLTKPELKLVILDLNGTLVWRPGRASTTYEPKLRRGLKKFTKYLFENFAVMVWSSSSPRSVFTMCQSVFSAEQREKLVAVWARDTLGLNQRDYNRKVQTYKDLSIIWNSHHLKQIKQFSQKDTIILDDSIEKVKQHPYNLIAVPEYDIQLHNSGEDNALFVAKAYLEKLRTCSNVSAYMFSETKIDFGQHPAVVSRMPPDIANETALD